MRTYLSRRRLGVLLSSTFLVTACSVNTDVIPPVPKNVTDAVTYIEIIAEKLNSLLGVFSGLGIETNLLSKIQGYISQISAAASLIGSVANAPQGTSLAQKAIIAINGLLDLLSNPPLSILISKVPNLGLILSAVEVLLPLIERAFGLLRAQAQRLPSKQNRMLRLTVEQALEILKTP